MTNAVATMTSTITSDALWGVVGNIMPFTLTVVLFAFGYYLVRRQLQGVSKGKNKS